MNTTTNQTTTRRETMSENTTEIVKPKSIEQQVAEWSATDAVLIAAVEATKGVTVAGHAEGPKKGREAVHKCLMELVDLRAPIEKRRQELKRPILDLGNLVDSEAKRLTAILTPREAELRTDRDAYDAIEKKRIEDEKEAERMRIQKRVESMVSAGLTPDIKKATHFSDELFDAMIEDGKAEQTKRNRAAQVAQELTSLGDDCTDAEAYGLTTEQAEHRLTVARKAFADREEAARIKREEEAAEQKRIADEAEAKRKADQEEADRKRNEEIEKERAARAKLEVGSRRSMELAALGSIVAMDECAEWTDEVYAAALNAATDAKVLRDEESRKQREKADQQAAELRRMQEAEAQRIKAENDAKEAARIAQEAKDKEEREETERKEEQARAEALKPDIEKAQAWFEQARESIPVVPQIADQKIAAGLQSARKAILAKIIEEDFLPF